MAKGKPKILLTNDDGIDAPGIQAMHAALRKDYETLVVAPMYEKSGSGCSLSLADEMEVNIREEKGKVWGYAVDGTPADCVKFALTAVPGYQPDYVLSGINYGMNVGNSVFYSGTVAATIEATLFGVPAMACSLACWGYPEAFFDEAAKVVRRMVPWVLKQPMRPRTFWNLNIPNKSFEKMGDVRYTTHGTGFFMDEFEQYRTEGDSVYYRNVGTKLVECAKHKDADDRCVTQGHVSMSLLSTNLSLEQRADDEARFEKEWRKLMEG